MRLSVGVFDLQWIQKRHHVPYLFMWMFKNWISKSKWPSHVKTVASLSYAKNELLPLLPLRWVATVATVLYAKMSFCDSSNEQHADNIEIDQNSVEIELGQ